MPLAWERALVALILTDGRCEGSERKEKQGRHPPALPSVKIFVVDRFAGHFTIRASSPQPPRAAWAEGVCLEHRLCFPHLSSPR